MLDIEKFLNNKIQSKEEFSKYSLMNKDGISEEDADKIIKLAIEKELLIYEFVYCPYCKGKCKENFYQLKSPKDQKCFFCAKKFSIEENKILIVKSNNLLDSYLESKNESKND